MGEFFIKDYIGGEFILYGNGHLIALTIIVAACFSLLLIRNWDEKQKKVLLYMMGGVLLANEVGWHAWNVYWGTWDTTTMLPLHVCSITIWSSVYMVFSGNRNIYFYEAMYFLCIGGATQALLTPEAGIYGFPHYRAFQTFISHGLLVIFPLYMTIVENIDRHFSRLSACLL